MVLKASFVDFSRRRAQDSDRLICIPYDRQGASPERSFFF
jgi:hypothetical protein